MGVVFLGAAFLLVLAFAAGAFLVAAALVVFVAAALVVFVALVVAAVFLAAGAFFVVALVALVALVVFLASAGDSSFLAVFLAAAGLAALDFASFTGPEGPMKGCVSDMKQLCGNPTQQHDGLHVIR